MSRLRIELKLRGLRAELGAQFRRGAPVIGSLRSAVMALEQQAAGADLEYLRERLQSLLQDWRLSLLVRANPWLILQRELYAQSAQKVGPALLGNVIVTGDGRAARITEVIASDQPPPDAVMATLKVRGPELAGRLCLVGEKGSRHAQVLCGHASEISTVTITGIEPLEGLALMAGACELPETEAEAFHGADIVRALGLMDRHHGSDLTRRQNDIRIASILQASPLAIGQARRRRPSTREWHWGIPRVSRRHRHYPDSP